MNKDITVNGITFSLTYHAAKQSLAKGFSLDAVLKAAAYPSVTYANGRYEGQVRCIRDGIVAVVDESSHHIVTVYENVRETAPRADQTDRDARRYASRYNSRRAS